MDRRVSLWLLLGALGLTGCATVPYRYGIDYQDPRLMDAPPLYQPIYVTSVTAGHITGRVAGSRARNESLLHQAYQEEVHP